MFGDRIRAELRAPLDGPREYDVVQKGPFTLRFNVPHIGEVLAAKARLNVEGDVRNFRAMVNRRRNLTRLA